MEPILNSIWSLAPVAILVILYFVYVNLIARRNAAREALSGIDTQLQMRYDLIPNILTIAKKYMQHEADLITQVTELRSRALSSYDKTSTAAVSEHLDIASQLASQMSKLQVSMEAYPNLKADTQMTEAMRNYNEVESRISAARRGYNAAVTDLNNAVDIFPSSIFARLLGITSMPYYVAEEASRAAVKAGDYLN